MPPLDSSSEDFDDVCEETLSECSEKHSKVRDSNVQDNVQQVIIAKNKRP